MDTPEYNQLFEYQPVLANCFDLLVFEQGTIPTIAPLFGFRSDYFISQ